MSGALVVLLHAHLPYVNHPEHEYALEENWLFEALSETYIPLISMLHTLMDEGIRPNLTLSISPPLTEMLNDAQLRARFMRAMEHLVDLANAEIERTEGTEFEPLAHFYRERFTRILSLYDSYNRDLIAELRRLQDAGAIEIITTAATHAYLPAYAQHPYAVRAQIRIGCESYTRNFGRRPRGFWLPECGYFAGLDSFLKEEEVEYSFLESHGLIHGRPRPSYSVFKPAFSPAGVVLFGRDFHSAHQVWSAESGYPGDPLYRELYRDIGFDLPQEYIERVTRLNGIRTFTGIKYYRITDRNSQNKLPYDRAAAMKKVQEHALHFVAERKRDSERLEAHGCNSVITATFDAELFGHWWFEGIEWLEQVIRTAQNEKSAFEMVRPSDYLEKAHGERLETVEPSPSSWGEKGYSEVWINERNREFYRSIHEMIAMIETSARAVAKEPNRHTDEERRLLVQALREMLLAQSSDWFFLIAKERSSAYAERRIRQHLQHFEQIMAMRDKESYRGELLAEIERRGAIFPWLTTL